MEPRTLLEALSVAERLKDTTRHCYTRELREEIRKDTLKKLGE